jgi:hypothetical protein
LVCRCRQKTKILDGALMDTEFLGQTSLLADK